MITLCKGCGAALDERVEYCLCGLANPWFDRRGQQPGNPFTVFWALLEPFVSLSWRTRPARCPACDAEAPPDSVRCAGCGASLQSARLHDRSTRSLEGIGVTIFLIAGLGYAAWSRVEPLVYRIAPEFRATKRGPAEIPVVVRIRQAGLGITNDSAERRSCVVEVGTLKIFRTAPVTLEPHQERELPYTGFADGPEGLAATAGYRRARQGIAVDCVDSRGVSRRVSF